MAKRSRMGPASWTPRSEVVFTRGSDHLAVVLMCTLIFCVALGPRMRLLMFPGRPVDIRLQDILIIPSMAYIWLMPTPVRSRMSDVWGSWCMALCGYASIVTMVYVLVETQTPVMERIGFLVRGMEPFVLATVMCGLALRSGDDAGRWALRALHATFLANAAWVAYQMATGSIRTLVGTDVGNLVESYGPKLVGEPTVFGTGAFFGLMAALAVAEHRSPVVPRFFAFAMLAVAGTGAFVSQSRIWLGSVVTFGLLAVRSERPGSRILRATTLVATGAVLVVCVQPAQFANRMSATGVQRSLTGRISDIWSPMIDIASARPVTLLMGVGPGGIRAASFASEAHNLLLRSWLDYGIPGMVLFVGMGAMIFSRASAVARAGWGSPTLKIFANFACLSLVGIVISGLVEDSFTAVTSSHLVMIAVGLFAAEWMRERDPAQETVRDAVVTRVDLSKTDVVGTSAR